MPMHGQTNVEFKICGWIGILTGCNHTYCDEDDLLHSHCDSRTTGIKNYLALLISGLIMFKVFIFSRSRPYVDCTSCLPLGARNVFPVRYKFCILPTQCICVFRMVLTINSDCFPKQH
jgi:hypothetical protein